MLKPTAKAAAWAATLLTGAGLAMLPIESTHQLGIGLLIAGGVNGLVAALIEIHGRRRFSAVADGLAMLSKRGREINERHVGSQLQYDLWVDDLNGWYADASEFVRTHISEAEMEIFETVTSRGRYVIRGAFNGDHANALHALPDYRQNLKEITARFLSAGP